MKLLLFAAVLVATASARQIKIGSVKDCGSSSATVRFSGTVKTDPVPVPGALDATAVIDNSVPSPDDLIIVKETIRKSDNYKVPCLDLIAGSCDIPVCAAINNFPGLICPNFPPDLPCECPIPAGKFTNDISIPFDEKWLAIEGGADGDYTSRFDFQTNPGVSVGCVEIEFTLTSAKHQ